MIDHKLKYVSATVETLRRLTLLLGFVSFLCGQSFAQTTTTFDFTADDFISEHSLNIGATVPSISEGDILLSFTKDDFSADLHDVDGLRYVSLYTGNTITLTSQDYPIESIVLTFAEAEDESPWPSQTTWTASTGTYDYSAQSWTGVATSVKFSCVNLTGMFRLQKIVVTTSETAVEKQTPTLAFANESYTLVLGETFTPPTLSGVPEDATVTYASSNTDVATVDASTGEVTVVAAGTTTITATTSETTTYLAGTAQYELEVTEKATTRVGNIYKKVTSASDIRDGGIYLIAGTIEVEGTLTTYAMSEQDGNVRKGITVTLTDETIDTQVNGDEQPLEVVLEEISSGRYALRLSSGEYLANLKNTTTNKIGTESATDVTALSSKAQWKVKYANGGISIISCYQKNYEKGLLMSEAGTFNAYLTSESKTAVSLYQRVEDVTIKTREGYATLYADKAIFLPNGLEATTISGLNDNNLTMPWQYEAADTIPANTAVLLRGTYGTTYTCPLLDKTFDAVSGNVLYGTTTAETPAEDADAYFYYLTYSKVDGVKTLGFFWLADDGAPVVNTPYRAYLKLPKSQSSASTKGFSLIDSATTAIQSVETSSGQPRPIYTLSGVYMGTDASHLPAGLYIVGGQKIIVR